MKQIVPPTKTAQKQIYAKINDKTVIPDFDDTIPYMRHPNYKCRLIAEYWQTAIRYIKLEKALEDLEDGKIEKSPSTPLHLLTFQRDTMGWYLDSLRERAKYEEVDLLAIFRVKQRNK